MVLRVDVLQGVAQRRRDSHSFARLVVSSVFLLLSLLLQMRSANAQSSSFDGPSTRPLDLQSFQTELRRIQDTLQRNPQQDQIAALERNLPLSWNVETLEHEYDISTEPLHSLLSSARKDSSQREQLVMQAQEWIAELASEVNGYAAGGQAAQLDPRAKLERILSSPEFGRVYEQSAWERFKQRVSAWIWQRVGALLRRMSGHPMAARALAWLILLAAVTGVALLLFRAWRRRAQFEELKAPAATVVQSWQEWIHMAQVAADRGAYRDAIHALYWAGIVYLENSRIIPCEPTRTPRERLRRLRSQAQISAGDANRHAVLHALTVRLEKIWYAGTPATQQDFTESAHLVQELGCRWQ